MTACPTYREPFGSQLKQGGATGGVDCTCWAARAAIAHATCGAVIVSGRTVRLQSDEPIPDPRSPGLNLQQVADVALKHGVYLEVHIGYYALTWKEYEAARSDGRGAIVQGVYSAIADSRYDAGRGFRGTHAIEEDQHQTLDSLADGRAPGVFQHDGTLYDRRVMRAFAEALFGKDRIWCALTRDTAPDLRATIRPAAGHARRAYRVFNVTAQGRVSDVDPYRVQTTAGIDRPCSAPRAVPGPGGLRFLVQIQGGPHNGEWVARRWSHAA